MNPYFEVEHFEQTWAWMIDIEANLSHIFHN